MKTIFALIFAVLLGIGIGITTGWLRITLAPWEGLPTLGPVESKIASKPSAENPAPIATVDQLEYDFGSLDLDGKGQYEFSVTNRGNGLLKLTKGETTCRCTSSDLERAELPPGDSTKITISWHATNEPGSYQQSASFYTNDPARPKFTITISGKITATVRVRPSILILSRISPNESTKGCVSVLNYLEEPLKIESWKFEENNQTKHFDLAVSPLSEEELKSESGAKNGYLLTVTAKSGLPQGAFKQRILITTNNPEKAELSISVEGDVGKDISVVGPGWDFDREILYLGSVKSEAGLSQKLLLIVRGPYRKEVQFKPAEKQPESLKISLGETSEINDGQVYQTPLFIEIPKDSLPTSHMGKNKGGESDTQDDATIEIETTHPEIPKIRIPVRFAVER